MKNLTCCFSAHLGLWLLLTLTPASAGLLDRAKKAVPSAPQIQPPPVQAQEQVQNANTVIQHAKETERQHVEQGEIIHKKMTAKGAKAPEAAKKAIKKKKPKH